MTTADMSLVAKESILVEKLNKNMPAQFFCPILYNTVHVCMYVVYVLHSYEVATGLVPTCSSSNENCAKS